MDGKGCGIRDVEQTDLIVEQVSPFRSLSRQYDESTTPSRKNERQIGCKHPTIFRRIPGCQVGIEAVAITKTTHLDILAYPFVLHCRSLGYFLCQHYQAP